MKNFRVEAIILSIGLLLLGVFIERGFSEFAGRDRSVNVKGLAEMEVPADKVTWPLVYKSLGNDLNALYEEIKRSNRTITEFLKEKGLTDKEISINAPVIVDMKAERYGNNQASPYRYNVTTVITVTSNKVDLVRGLITEQGELLKRGIAITTGDYQYNIQYEYTGLNTIKPQMIEEATKTHVRLPKSLQKIRKVHWVKYVMPIRDNSVSATEIQILRTSKSTCSDYHRLLTGRLITDSSKSTINHMN